MKFRKILLATAVVGLAGNALAEGDVTIAINSEELGFNLHDMQEGENRSIIDESGRSVLVTRTADGFTFNIDGEIVEMPALFGGHHGMVWSEDGEEVDVNRHVIHRTQIAGRHDMNGTMIISGKPIDAATQQQIKLLLESAGYDSDVNFIDREVVDGERVFIKRIVETDESPRS
jgi:hypothetical protein